MMVRVYMGSNARRFIGRFSLNGGGCLWYSSKANYPPNWMALCLMLPGAKGDVEDPVDQEELPK